MHVLRAIPVRSHVQHPRRDRVYRFVVGELYAICNCYAVASSASYAGVSRWTTQVQAARTLYCTISCDNTADIL